MNELKLTILSCVACLAAVSGFSQCGTTGDTIFVNSQSQLDALSGCVNIEGSLYINDGDVQNLAPLSSLESIEEHLVLFENISLLSLQGLDQLEFIGGDFKVISNFTLQEITNLSALAHIGGDIYMESNLGIDNLDGLQQLDSLHGNFEIYDNPTIQDLTGFENVTYVAGDFILREFQNSLTDLTALSSLQQIDGSLKIYLRGISTLEGLEALGTIGGNLRVDSTLLLFDLDPLSGLENIGGSLQIEGNESLFSIAGMTSLQGIGGDVSITSNPGLSNCCSLKPLIDEEPMQVGGDILLQSNASGCNTEAEILECIIDQVGEVSENPLKVIVDENQIQIILDRNYRYRLIGSSGRVLEEGRGESGIQEVDLSRFELSIIIVQVLTEDGEIFNKKILVR